jgi:hypothetical protein
MNETVGQRLYRIRLACGDGVRAPESIREFTKRVLRVTGVRYHDAAISLLERMQQGWRLDDVSTFAQVDPLHRGPVWLAYGDSAGEAINHGPAGETQHVAPSTVHLTKPVSSARKKGRGRRSG